MRKSERKCFGFLYYKRKGDDLMYGIKLNGAYLLMNTDNSDYERFATFEDAIDAEALYPDYTTEIIEL